MTAVRLESLQVLRGMAALLVVFHHAGRAVTVHNPNRIADQASAFAPSPALVGLGSIGVDLFFILSGFLMIHISGQYAARNTSIVQFLAQRLMRIWPLYVVITFCAVIPLAIEALVTGSVPFDLQPLRLLSVLFIPSFNENGLLQPILGVGWSLNYEVLFYLSFAFVLLLMRQRLFVGLAGVLGSLFLLGQSMPSTVAGTFLGDSLIFEFLAGAAIAKLWAAGHLSRVHAAAWLATSGVLLLLIIQAAPEGLARPFAMGIPAAFFFIGILALEGRVSWPRWLRNLGDASYSVYLIHVQVIYSVAAPVLYVAGALGLARISVLGAGATAVFASIFAGALVFRFLEKPLLAGCREAYDRLTTKRRPPLQPFSA